jgi:hypothetical protein
MAAMLAGCGGGGASHLLPGSTGSGGSSGGSTVPVNGNAKGTATVVARASLNASAVPQMYDRKTVAAKRSTYAKLKTQSSQISSVEVDGTLYQGSASAIPVTNTQNVPLSASGTITVSETFSNVIPANNDWVLFEFYAVANDGSKTQIGSLGTFVNVGSGTTDTNLSAASTQTLQVAGGLMALGAISTYDIEKTTALASDLATKIAAQNPTVDSQTGLYDTSVLMPLLSTLATAYERDITITASGASEVSVVYDSTQPDENDLAYNANTFATALGLPNLITGTGFSGASSYASYSPLYVLGTPVGLDCDVNYSQCTTSAGTVPLHSPSSGYSDAQPSYVQAEMYSATNGTITLRNVYGGHIIIGAHNDLYADDVVAKARKSGASTVRVTSTKRSTTDVTTQTYGATVAVAGEAPGASSQTLTLVNTTQTANISDAQAAAFNDNFGYESFGGFDFQTTALSNAAGNVPAYEVDCPGENCDSEGLIYSPYGSNNNVGLSAPANGVETMTYDAWNAFNLPTSSIQVCSTSNCTSVSTPSTINVEGALDDPGTNPAVYDWAPGGSDATVSVMQDPNPPCCRSAYLVTYTIPANNTAAITGTITGSDVQGLAPSIPARPTFYMYSPNANDVQFTLQLTDTNGNISSANNNVNSNNGTYAFPSIAQPAVFHSFKITYTIPAGDVPNAGNPATTGTFDLQGLYNGGYFSATSDNCC